MLTKSTQTTMFFLRQVIKNSSIGIYPKRIYKQTHFQCECSMNTSSLMRKEVIKSITKIGYANHKTHGPNIAFDMVLMTVFHVLSFI